MSLTLRVATGLAALSLLGGCGPVPADSIPGTPVSTAPSIVVTTPADPPTPQAVPTTAAPTADSATTKPAAAGGTNTGGGSGSGSGACPADEYRNVDGVCVHRPVPADQPPPGATAQCNDGTYSFSQHHSGTCSHHGGVRRWL
jgi:hypothetical protein